MRYDGIGWDGMGSDGHQTFPTNYWRSSFRYIGDGDWNPTGPLHHAARCCIARFWPATWRSTRTSVADLASSSIIGPSVQWSTQWRAPFLQHAPSMCSKHAVPALFCTCECMIYLILASVEQNCRQNCFDLSSKLVKLAVELNGHVRWSATM